VVTNYLSYSNSLKHQEEDLKQNGAKISPWVPLLQKLSKTHKPKILPPGLRDSLKQTQTYFGETGGAYTLELHSTFFSPHQEIYIYF